MNKDLVQAVEKLDLEVITRNMRTKLGWSATQAERVEAEYRCFLALCIDNPNQALPSAELDAYWEMHILDTRKYAEDCMQAFGIFLHHVPNAIERVDGLTKAGLTERFKAMQNRFQEAFGAPMSNAVRSGCDDCIPDYDDPYGIHPDGLVTYNCAPERTGPFGSRSQGLACFDCAQDHHAPYGRRSLYS